jgi:hypothetical protein
MSWTSIVVNNSTFNNQRHEAKDKYSMLFKKTLTHPGKKLLSLRLWSPEIQNKRSLWNYSNSKFKFSKVGLNWRSAHNGVGGILLVWTQTSISWTGQQGLGGHMLGLCYKRHEIAMGQTYKGSSIMPGSAGQQVAWDLEAWVLIKCFKLFLKN